MNNEKLIVEERSRDIGNFMVGRLLPFRKKRQVGPFTFIDHMGPTLLQAPNFMDVNQHPHIGLSTLTYLLEGEIHHQDSTGADKIITPGDVGFMTAGKGVTHTERTPQRHRTDQPYKIHGYQIWVAMPKAKEEISPRFDFIEKEELPAWKENGLEMTLVAGEGYGRKSSLPVHSPLFMLDVKATKDTCLEINGQLEGEIAMVVTHGKITEDGVDIEAGQMLISKTENACYINLEKGTRLLLFGGKAFPEERYLYWNFVSSSKERIEQAKMDWENKQFPKVKGDNTYIPLPKKRF
jgi:redox-sensitive bicupin YhaK (pirin superfamily)